MEEPTCVIHSLSYTPAIPNEAKEENPIYALGESVSFGRFTSESLSWEKWSAFNRNRYVEEAEKFSRPGSVKQKKAYLEAHFRKMASLKDEQEEDSDEKLEEEDNQDSGHDLDSSNLSSTKQLVEKEAENLSVRVDQNQHNLDDEAPSRSSKAVESDRSEDVMNVEKHSLVDENQGGLIEAEERRSQESSTTIGGDSIASSVKRNPPLSSFIPSVEARTSVAQPQEVGQRAETKRKSWVNRFVSSVMKKIGGSSKASKKNSSLPLKTSSKERKGQVFCCGAKFSPNSLKEQGR